MCECPDDPREVQARIDDAASSARFNAIEAQRNQMAYEYEAASDFRHGYVAYCGPLEEASVAPLCQAFRKIHRSRGAQPIVLELNTPGGSINAGLALIDDITWLRAQGVHFTIRVRGEAASMGAVVLQAADQRECGKNSWIMLHRAAFGSEGKTFEVEDQLKLTKRFEKTIFGILGDRTGKGLRYWDRKLTDDRKDVWFTAEQAAAEGLIDAVA